MLACATAPRMRLRNSSWKPFITETVVISATTPMKMPSTEASEMNEMNPLRRLARR